MVWRAYFVVHRENRRLLAALTTSALMVRPGGVLGGPVHLMGVRAVTLLVPPWSAGLGVPAGSRDGSRCRGRDRPSPLYTEWTRCDEASTGVAVSRRVAYENVQVADASDCRPNVIAPRSSPRQAVSIAHPGSRRPTVHIKA